MNPSNMVMNMLMSKLQQQNPQGFAQVQQWMKSGQNPQQIINQMLQSGQITQSQLNQAQQLAGQFQGNNSIRKF